MSLYMEAPNEAATWPSVFLAGGITGCPDWQHEVADKLKNDHLWVINPRRENFPMGDPQAGQEQIKWEHTMLKKADFISFWFPKETLCPITLFELGKWLHTEPIVGTEPGYERALDVQVQTRLELGSFYTIVKSLDELVQAIQFRIGR